MGVVAHGVLLGGAWLTIDRFVPQPGGATLWFTFNAVQLAWLAEGS